MSHKFIVARSRVYNAVFGGLYVGDPIAECGFSDKLGGTFNLCTSTTNF